jgi:hypothetical protein
MSLNVKKSFDQYFELDYNRLTWFSSDIADNLHILKQLNELPDKLNFSLTGDFTLKEISQSSSTFTAAK